MVIIPSGQKVWQNGGEYVTFTYGKIEKAKAKTIERYTYKLKRQVTQGDVVVPVEIPNQPPSPANSTNRKPAENPYVRVFVGKETVPAVVPSLPDVIRRQLSDGRILELENGAFLEQFIQDKKVLDALKINFPYWKDGKKTEIVGENLFFQRDYRNSGNMWVYHLDKDTGLQNVGYIDTLSHFLITDPKTTAIPNGPGKYFWEGRWLPGSDLYSKQTGTPLFISPDQSQGPVLPTAILLERGDKNNPPLLAYPDSKNPGFYRVQKIDSDGRTTWTEIVVRPASAAELENLAARVKANPWNAEKINRDFEAAHRSTTTKDATDEFYAPTGLFIGYGVDPNDRGPTHRVEKIAASVIGEPDITRVTVSVNQEVPKKPWTVTQIGYSLTVDEKLEMAKPRNIWMKDGRIWTRVRDDYYEPNLGKGFLKVTGTGENLAFEFVDNLP